MKSNRKAVVQAYIFLIVLIIPMIGMFLLLGLPKKQFFLGSIIGVILALISFAYLFMVWDPITLSPKNPSTRTASLTWISVVVFSGLIAGRFCLSIIGNRDELIASIVGTGFTWLMLTLSFVTFQVWHYREK